MPEDKNKTYDLNVDPEMAKMMPKPKMREDDPQAQAKRAPDMRPADQIPEIDPVTGEARLKGARKSKSWLASLFKFGGK